MNRLRTVIRCEEKAEERAYLALGRYYYHNLRDAENTVTEPYCIDIEAAPEAHRCRCGEAGSPDP